MKHSDVNNPNNLTIRLLPTQFKPQTGSLTATAEVRHTYRCLCLPVKGDTGLLLLQSDSEEMEFFTF